MTTSLLDRHRIRIALRSNTRLAQLEEATECPALSPTPPSARRSPRLSRGRGSACRSRSCWPSRSGRGSRSAAAARAASLRTRKAMRRIDLRPGRVDPRPRSPHCRRPGTGPAPLALSLDIAGGYRASSWKRGLKRLSARVREYFEAHLARDYRKQYSMQTPRYRRYVSYADFSPVVGTQKRTRASLSLIPGSASRK